MNGWIIIDGAFRCAIESAAAVGDTAAVIREAQKWASAQKLAAYSRKLSAKEAEILRQALSII